MSAPEFVHLHVHSDYSLLDGANDLRPRGGRATDEQPALALTDHGNLCGAIEFYKACRKRGSSRSSASRPTSPGSSRHEPHEAAAATATTT